MATMRCPRCTGDTPPFEVPIGDGIGEALMAQHMEEEHGDSGPAERLAARHARRRRDDG